MAKFLRSAASVLAGGIAGNAAYYFVVGAVSAISAGYSAHSAAVKNMPPYIYIPLGVLVFLGVAIGAHLIAYFFFSPKKETVLATPQIAQSSAPTKTVSPTTKTTTATDPDAEYLNALLHEIAENDERGIQNMVLPYRCELNSERFDGHPIHYIDFTFTVFNGSVYDISVSDEIGGHIKFLREKLYQPKEMQKNEAKNIFRGNTGRFTIRQVLSDNDVKYISSEGDSTPYWFDDLIITVAGAKRWSTKITPQRLIINGCITKDGRSHL